VEEITEMFNIDPEFDVLIDGEMAEKFPEAFIWRAKRRAQLAQQLKKERAEKIALLRQRGPLGGGCFGIDDVETAELPVP